MSARRVTAAAGTAGGAGLGGVLGSVVAGPGTALLAALGFGVLVLIGMTLFWPSAVPFERLSTLLRGGSPAPGDTAQKELAAPKKKSSKALAAEGGTREAAAPGARKAAAAKK